MAKGSLLSAVKTKAPAPAPAPAKADAKSGTKRKAAPVPAAAPAAAVSTDAKPAKKAKTAATKAAAPAPAPAPVSAAAEKPAKPAKGKARAKAETQAALEDMAAEAGVPAPAASKATMTTRAGTKAKAAAQVSEPAPTSVSRPGAGAKKGRGKAAPAPAPSPVEEEDAEMADGSDAAAEPDAEAEADEEDEEEDVRLRGFSGSEDGSDSSDDEGGVAEEAGVDVSTLPTVAKDDEAVRRKLERAKREKSEERGVVFLGRIPHGFYEDEMRAYFTQFGDVTRLRLSRNKKTGRSKHYAYVEFASAPVAKIVAETMDNYLLLGHLLRCRVVPTADVHPELWIGANRKYRVVPRDRVARVTHNKPRTEVEQARAEDRLLKRQEERKRKLAAAGIDYSFDEVAYKKKPRAATEA